MNRQVLSVLVISCAIGVSGCATSAKQPSRAASERAAIVGNIPSGSPFSKLDIGMSRKQVHDLIGDPTDTFTYSTGKAWIPFYFGKDVMRFEDLYKGMGRITYTGIGIGGSNLTVNHIEYDPNEDGYPNRR